MLNIYLYLYILLGIQNALLITCEHVKLTSTNYTRPTRKDIGKNLVWDPHHKSISASLDRRKRVSHHRSGHHHIQKVYLHLLNDKSTSKPILMHHFNQKKDRSLLDCNKRHIAFEQYAKRINQTINATEEEKRSSRYVCESQNVTSSLDDYKSAVSKRTGIANPVLKPTPASVTSEGKALVAKSTTVKSINVTPTTPLIITKRRLSSVLTTTSVNVKSSEATTSKLDLLKSLADTGQISGIYSGPDGRTVLTKVFIIPIQERLPTITKYKIRSDVDKTSKRRESKSRNKSKKKNSISKVSKRKPKHASKQKRNKKRKKKRKKQSGKCSKKVKNKNNKKRKKNVIVKRKKRLKDKRKFEKNKRKTMKKGASHKDSKIKSDRKIKTLTKQEGDVQECRKDKTNHSHKSLKKKKKRNKIRHTTGDHLSKVTKKIRKIQVNEKESNHGTDTDPNKNEKALKRYSTPKEEKNKNPQTKRIYNGITTAHKDMDRKEIRQDKSIHKLKKEDKIISRIETCSDKKKNYLEKYQKLSKEANGSLQKKENQKNTKKSVHEVERNIASNAEILLHKKKNYLEENQLMTEKSVNLGSSRKEDENDNSLRNKEVQNSKRKSTNQMEKEKVVFHAHIRSDQKKNNLEAHQKLMKESSKCPHRKLTNSGSKTAQDNFKKKSTYNLDTAENRVEKEKSIDRIEKEKKTVSHTQIHSNQKKNNFEEHQKLISESNENSQEKLSDNVPETVQYNMEKKSTHKPEKKEKRVEIQESTDRLGNEKKIGSYTQIFSHQKKNNLQEYQKLFTENNKSLQRKLTVNPLENAQDNLEKKSTNAPGKEDQIEKETRIVSHTHIRSDEKKNNVNEHQKLITESNEDPQRKLIIINNGPKIVQDSLEKKNTYKSEKKEKKEKEENIDFHTQIRLDQKKNILEYHKKLIKESNEGPPRKLDNYVETAQNNVEKKCSHKPENEDQRVEKVKSTELLEKKRKIVSHTQIRPDQKENNLKELQKLIKKSNESPQRKLTDNRPITALDNLGGKGTLEAVKEETRIAKEKTSDPMQKQKKIISYTQIRSDQKQNNLEEYQKLIKEGNEEKSQRKLIDNGPEIEQDNLEKKNTYESEKDKKEEEKAQSTERMEEKENIVSHTQVRSDQKKNILEDHQKLMKESNKGPQTKLIDNNPATAQHNYVKKSTQQPDKEEKRVEKEKSTDRMEKLNKIVSYIQIRSDQKENKLDEHERLIKKYNECSQWKHIGNSPENGQDNLVMKSTQEPEKEKKKINVQLAKLKKIISYTQNSPDQKKNNVEHQNNLEEPEKEESTGRMEKENEIVSHTLICSDQKKNSLEEHEKPIKKNNEGSQRKLIDSGSEIVQNNLEKKNTYEPKEEEKEEKKEKSTDQIEKEEKIVTHTQIHSDQKKYILEDLQKLMKESNNSPQRKLIGNDPKNAQDNFIKKSTQEPEKEKTRVEEEKINDRLGKLKKISSYTHISSNQIENNLEEHQNNLEEPGKDKSTDRKEKENQIVSHALIRSDQRKNNLEEHQQLIKENNEDSQRKLIDNDTEIVQNNLEKKNTFEPEVEEKEEQKKKSTDRIEKEKKIVYHTQIRSNQNKNILEDLKKLMKENDKSPQRKLIDNGSEIAEVNLVRKTTQEPVKDEKMAEKEPIHDRLEKLKKFVCYTQISSDQKKNNLEEHQNNLEKAEKEKGTDRMEKGEIVSHALIRSDQKKNNLEEHQKLIKQNNEDSQRKFIDNGPEIVQNNLEKKNTYEPEVEGKKEEKEKSTDRMEKKEKIVSPTEICSDQKKNSLEDLQKLMKESNKSPQGKLIANGSEIADVNFVKKMTQEARKEEKRAEKETNNDRLEKLKQIVSYTPICSGQKKNNLEKHQNNLEESEEEKSIDRVARENEIVSHTRSDKKKNKLQEHQKLVKERNNPPRKLTDNGQETAQDTWEKKNTYEPEKEEKEKGKIVSHILIRSEQKKNKLEEHQKLTTEETGILQRQRKENNKILLRNMEVQKGNKITTNKIEKEKASKKERHQEQKEENKCLHSKDKHNDKETAPFNIEKKEVNKDKQKSTHRMEKEKEIVCPTEAEYIKRGKDLDGHQMLRIEDDETPHRKRKDNDKEIAYKNLKKEEVHKDKRKIIHETGKEKKIVSLTETCSNKKEEYLERHQNLKKKKEESLKSKRKNNVKEDNKNLKNKVLKKEQNEMEKENVTFFDTHSTRKKKNVDVYQNLQMKLKDKSRAITHKKLAKKINEARKQLNKETKEYEKDQENNKKALHEQHKEKKVFSRTPSSEYTENFREYQKRSQT